ncbi:hypothetical protein [Paenibacillus sp. FSL K6-1318]|uniref:hypothetical protein n=1 Tax=Paenibacillus sp. FSL K6-1318 TaxID=2975291 RepID=UPI0030EED1E2
MSIKLVPKEDSLFPKEYSEMKIGDLLNLDGVDVVKKGDKIKLKRTTGQDILTLEYNKFQEGEAESVTLTKVKKGRKKKDLTELAKKMYKDGKTQAEIADYIDATQPYVSKLLKS